MFTINVGYRNGHVDVFGPFPTEARANEYGKSIERDLRPHRWYVGRLIIPYVTVVKNIEWVSGAKPTVTCELVNIGQVHGHPSNVHRANVQRTSEHPRLGADREGSMTVTSQLLRVDFELGVMETLNTVYKFEGVNRHG